MSRIQPEYPVVLSNIGTPRVGDHVRLDTSLASPFLEILTTRNGKETLLRARLENGRKPEDGSLHFNGELNDGTKVAMTVHRNSSNKVFVYGQTNYTSGRGGTGVWVAEEEEDARGEK